MEPIYPYIEVQLTGNDGNAFAVLAQIKKAMRKDPVARERIDEFMTEAISGDYNHLLQTCMKWVTVV